MNPLTALADRHLLRTGHSCNRYLLARIAAPLGDQDRQRPAANIGIVIDRSGSMEGSKIAHAIEAACYTVNRLTARDRFAVVSYDNEIDIVVPSTQQPRRPRRMPCGESGQYTRAAVPTCMKAGCAVAPKSPAT